MRETSQGYERFLERLEGSGTTLRELAALPALNEPLRLNHTLRVNAFAPVPAFPLAFRPDLNAQ